jgi:hypothetical protein
MTSSVRKASFTIVLVVCQGTRSGGGIERVFFSAGKQHDALKKRTMDKTLESTLKVSINTTLPTCDDKGVFDDTDRKHK